MVKIWLHMHSHPLWLRIMLAWNTAFHPKHLLPNCVWRAVNEVFLLVWTFTSDGNFLSNFWLHFSSLLHIPEEDYKSVFEALDTNFSITGESSNHRQSYFFASYNEFSCAKILSSRIGKL